MTARRALIWILATGTLRASTGAQGYDPMEISAAPAPRVHDRSVTDTERDREIPIRVYLPAGKDPAPVVLFSHGLGGSREGGTYLAEHWSRRGFVVVALQHPGSDQSVWKDKAPGTRMGALSQAADLQNLLHRVQDIPAVLEQLERWDGTVGHVLAGRLDMDRVGMSGHSFGALTTQAVSGQSLPMGGARFSLPGIRAAIMFSPSSPRRGSADRAFGGVKIPWMLMTGTHDVSPIGNTDVASRLAVFPALPAGEKYELVLEGAEHAAFADQRPGPSGATRNLNHHRVILALSTAFWEAYLSEDASARAWLDGSGPDTVLEEGDRWQKK